MYRIKYFLSLSFLSLVILNIPSILLFSTFITLGSILSYFMFFIGLILILLNNKKYPDNLKILFFISVVYYIFSGFNYLGEFSVFIIEFIKFSVFIFALYTAQQLVGIKTILFFVILGSLTILFDSLIFRFRDIVYDTFINEYGRYAGFYINANSASAVCLFGYSLVLATNYRFRVLLLLFFTLMGILTLSRTFIFAWVILNILFAIKSKKHLKFISLFLLCFPFLLGFFKIFGLREDRFNSLFNFFSYGKLDDLLINNNDRIHLVENYYSYISSSIFFGNGFSSFKSGDLVDKAVGIHNTFLLILGESGIIAFFMFLGFFVYLFIYAFRVKQFTILPLLLTASIFIQFNVSHNFFDMGFRVFMMTFLLYLLNNNLNEKYFHKN